MEIKITKREILQDINNDMTTYKKYLVYAKVYNTNKTWSKKLKFITNIFKEDIFEYAEKDTLTLTEQKNITNELIYSMLDCYNTEKDTTKVEDFTEALENMINYCNNTIKEYNTSIRGFYY